MRFDSTLVNCIPNYVPIGNCIPALNSVPQCNSINNTNNCPIYVGIYGNTYHDGNSNCIKDWNEPAVAYKAIDVYQGGNFIEKVFTNLNGSYSMVGLNSGTYTLIADTIGTPLTVKCPANDSISVTLTVGTSQGGVNFGYNCKSGFDLGIWYINNYQEFFPGENITLYNKIGDMAKIANGLSCNTVGVSGFVKILLTGPVSFVSNAVGALVPTSIHGDTIIWNISDFSTINPSTDFNIIYHTLASAQSGNQVCVKGWVSIHNGDKDTTNNYYNYCSSVVNSHDPNYKVVAPSDGLTNPYLGYLTYTIHFQNTGTAPAHNITLMDTMPSQLDPSTFILVGASHNVEASIVANGGMAEFDFKSIYLQDSTHNEPQSHGWVQYKIKLKPGMSAGTIIKNKASIYFDFNPPVVTNYAVNTICTSKKYKVINKSICNGAIYSFDGQPISVAGTYTKVKTTYMGCDSIITLHLNILPKSISTKSINKTICSNNPFYFNNSFLNKTGVYYDTFINYRGCDSILVLNLTVNSISNLLIKDTICGNYNYHFNNKNINITGVYYDTLQNYLGCDSFITLNLYVKPISNLSFSQNICIGSSISFHGNNLTTAGFYYDTLQNYLGCDSFITLHLNVYQPQWSSVKRSLCNNLGYYDFNGTHLTFAGTYYDTIQTYIGCDSFITLTLTQVQTTNSILNQTSCSNQFYSFNHLLLNSSGIYYDTLTNNNGCDSFITLHLTVLPSSTKTIYQTICSNNPYLFNGHLLNSTGKFYDTLTNYVGCDSVITLRLTALPSFNYNSSIITICEGSPYFYNGHVYTTNTQLYDTFKTQLGCDSIVGIKIIAIPAPDTSVVQSGNVLIAQAQHSSFYWYDCIEHQLIPNANDDTFKINHTGNYAVIVKDSLTLCSDTSSCRMVVVSGVEEQLIVSSNQLTIYPNPVGSQLTVSCNQYAVNTIEITDVLGRTQMVRQAHHDSDVLAVYSPLKRGQGGLEIDTENLPSGIYFIKATDAKGNIWNGKFVKE